MNTKTITLGLALALTLFAGCAKFDSFQVDPVEVAFDAALRGETTPTVAGVTGYSVRAYEVVNRTGDLVSVRITFASQAGTDLVKTKKFRVVDGRVMATDRKDIETHVLGNLDAMSFWAAEVETPTTWGQFAVGENAGLVGAFRFEAGESVAGEDYADVQIDPNDKLGPSLRLTLPDGTMVSSEPMERYQRYQAPK